MFKIINPRPMINRTAFRTLGNQNLLTGDKGRYDRIHFSFFRPLPPQASY